jgi:hypothetical protein
MKKRLYTSWVFKKMQDSELYEKVAECESGTEAAKKAKALAEEFHGVAFSACNMWPAVMTRAITSFVYVDPNDPSKTLKDAYVEEEDGEDEEDGQATAPTAAAVAAVVAPVVEPVVAKAEPVVVKVETPAPAPAPAPAKAVKVVKPAPVVAPAPAPAPAPTEAPKKEAFVDLFGGTEEVAEESESGFANEDSIDPDDDGDSKVPEGLF